RHHAVSLEHRQRKYLLNGRCPFDHYLMGRSALQRLDRLERSFPRISPNPRLRSTLLGRHEAHRNSTVLGLESRPERGANVAGKPRIVGEDANPPTRGLRDSAK